MMQYNNTMLCEKNGNLNFTVAKIYRQLIFLPLKSKFRSRFFLITSKTRSGILKRGVWRHFGIDKNQLSSTYNFRYWHFANWHPLSHRSLDNFPKEILCWVHVWTYGWPVSINYLVLSKLLQCRVRHVNGAIDLLIFPYVPT